MRSGSSDRIGDRRRPRSRLLLAAGSLATALAVTGCTSPAPRFAPGRFFVQVTSADGATKKTLVYSCTKSDSNTLWRERDDDSMPLRITVWQKTDAPEH